MKRPIVSVSYFPLGRRPFQNITQHVNNAERVTMVFKSIDCCGPCNRTFFRVTGALMAFSAPGRFKPLFGTRGGFPFLFTGESLAGPCGKSLRVFQAHLNDRVVSLVTSNKLNVRQSYPVCDLKTVDVVVTDLPNEDPCLSGIAEAGIEIL